jgi:hypothetical protein
MIKKEHLGNRMLTRMGWLTIQEGQEKLYKLLKLDIFEDEVKQRSNNGKRSTKSKGKDDNIESDIPV